MPTAVTPTKTDRELPPLDAGDVLRDMQTGQLLRVRTTDRTRDARGRPMGLVRYEILEDPHGWCGPAFTLADRDELRRAHTAVRSLFLARCDRAAGDLVPLTDAELAALTARREAAHREAAQTSLDTYETPRREPPRPNAEVHHE